MPGIDPRKLNESLSRAQKLINSEEFNNKVNKKAISAQNNADFLTEDEIQYESYAPEVKQKKLTAPAISKMSTNVLKSSNLPKEILEDIMKNPMDMSEDNSVSILDSFLDIPERKNRVVEQKTIQREHIQPTTTLNNTTQPLYVPQQTVDYGVIRALIDESIKRNLTEIKSAILTEGAQNVVKMMRVSGGNKIQVVDSKGNLYEGTLSLKKNLNK